MLRMKWTQSRMKARSARQLPWRAKVAPLHRHGRTEMQARRRLGSPPPRSWRAPHRPCRPSGSSRLGKRRLQFAYRQMGLAAQTNKDHRERKSHPGARQVKPERFCSSTVLAVLLDPAIQLRRGQSWRLRPREPCARCAPSSSCVLDRRWTAPLSCRPACTTARASSARRQA